MYAVKLTIQCALARVYVTLDSAMVTACNYVICNHCPLAHVLLWYFCGTGRSKNLGHLQCRAPNFVMIERRHIPNY